MKYYSKLLVFFLSPFFALANMASPIQEGSWIGTPFVNERMEIVREELFIQPQADFKLAEFQIKYHIQTEIDGAQVPLLFFAADYQSDFQVWLDGNPVNLKQVPASYTELEGTIFSDFDYLFAGEEEYISYNLKDSAASHFYVRLDDLKFFEVDLEAGQHLIEVHYTADEWIDYSDWVKKYSFRYVLSPAKYWKSFGGLEITLDASQVTQSLSTNLGTPGRGDLTTKAYWQFDQLPVEVVHIKLEPPMPALAKFLLAISPLGMTLFLAVPLVLLHYFAIRKHRLRRPDLRFSWVLNLGSMLLPFLVLVFYVYSYTLIDMAIGMHASNYHGYKVFMIFLYPFVFPVYWLLMWLVERGIRKYRHRTLGA